MFSVWSRGVSEIKKVADILGTAPGTARDHLRAAARHHSFALAGFSSHPEWMISLVQRTLIVAILSVFVVYTCDYLLLRFKIATNRNPYGTVTVRPYYAVPRKDGRTELMFENPQDQTCVHSLFPHVNDDPCWYLNRNKHKRINL